MGKHSLTLRAAGAGLVVPGLACNEAGRLVLRLSGIQTLEAAQELRTEWGAPMAGSSPGLRGKKWGAPTGPTGIDHGLTVGTASLVATVAGSAGRPSTGD